MLQQETETLNLLIKKRHLIDNEIEQQKRKIVKYHERVSNAYFVKLSSHGIPNDVIDIVLHQYLNMQFCVKHKTYFPTKLQTCSICFDRQTNFSGSSIPWLFYRFEKPIKIENGSLLNFDSEYLFEQHFKLYLNWKNPMIYMQRHDNDWSQGLSTIAISNRDGRNYLVLSTFKLDGAFHIYDWSPERFRYNVKTSILNEWFKKIN